MSEPLHPGFETHPLAESSYGEPWRVTDEQRAAWATDKVLAARERLARVKAACQAMIDDAAREAQDVEAFFLPLLEEWARNNPPRKGKTIRLLTGALSFRTVPGGPRVTDAEAALSWAKAEYADLVIVSERLDVNGIKDYVKASGDVPPGVEIIEPRESFDVKGA